MVCSVTSFALSGQAQIDLIEVYFYTLHSFGWRQADTYVDELKHACSMLADNPRMGRTSPAMPGGVRRNEHAMHVIVYKEIPNGRILVVRILGLHQEPGLHLIDEARSEL